MFVNRFDMLRNNEDGTLRSAPAADSNGKNNKKNKGKKSKDRGETEWTWKEEVDLVYTILMNCHKHESLRDETFCHIMKQTTNNKSSRPDSCQRGWRLFSIIAAYFSCTPV